MFDGHYGGHSVAHIGPGKIHILFLENPQGPGIGIDHIGEHGFEAGKVGTAFGVVYIVAKAKHILMKLIDILKGYLHRDSFTLS